MLKRRLIPRKNTRSGQALIEYILMILMTVGVFLTMDYQIKRTIGKVWKKIAQNVAPGCPSCEPPESLK